MSALSERNDSLPLYDPEGANELGLDGEPLPCPGCPGTLVPRIEQDDGFTHDCSLCHASYIVADQGAE